MEVFVEKEQKRKELEGYGVHDLRTLARQMGISRPTMKIKEELVEEIASILVGETKLKEGGNRGRNPSAKLTDFGIANFILPPSLQVVLKKHEDAETLSQVNMQSVSLSQSIQESLVNIGQKEGFLQVEGVDYYFWDLSTDKMVYLNDALVRGNELKVGDRVRVRCSESPAYAFAIANEVISINFDESFEPRCFCSFKNDISQSQEAFEAQNLKEGGVLVLEKSLKGKTLADISKTLNTFCENGFKVIALGTSLARSFYETIKEKIPCEEAVSYNINSQLWNLQRIKNVLQNLVVRVSSGEKLVLFALNIKKMVEDVIYCMKLDSPTFGLGGFDENRFIAYLSSFRRILKNGGSLTVVAVNS